MQNIELEGQDFLYLKHSGFYMVGQIIFEQLTVKIESKRGGIY